ncbi:hypothetical protein [Pseudoalteromonas lipolytica]|nr:hypothetical protein [Pseudoalteromonas lipolytica]
MMGWLSSFCSGVSRAVSSTVSAVKSGVSKAWEATKSVATKAVSWMAEKAETVVNSAKKVWKTVKQYIPVVRSVLKKAAELAPWPWLKGGLNLLEKGLLFIENFENTKLGKRISKAIDQVIKFAKDLHKNFFNDQELKEAKEREDLFKEAEAAAQGNSEAEKTIALAKMLNAYGIVNREVHDLLIEKSELLSFEHYLRLRATQKLLLEIEDTLRTSQRIENITEDDIFLIEIANEFLSETPTLSEQQGIKLDEIIYQRKKKRLLPFVFEEMIAAWYKTIEELETDWKEKSKEVSKLKIELKRLTNQQIISELDQQEMTRLKELQALVPNEVSRVDLLAKRKRERASYVYAAEGLMQTIEKSVEELEAEELEFLVEDSAEIGKLLIDCLQHGVQWEELEQEQKDMILDYANIFEEACKERTQSLLKVTA